MSYSTRYSGRIRISGVTLGYIHVFNLKQNAFQLVLVSHSQAAILWRGDWNYTASQTKLESYMFSNTGVAKDQP